MAGTLEVRRDREADVAERFINDTAEHRMRIVHDDGLYRHLRCNAPGTWCYGYNVVTWPGYLSVNGDCGDFTFSRVTDMFTFFRGDHINPDYWASKLPNRDAADGTRRYSRDLFVPRVMEWYTNHCEWEPDEDGSLKQALDDQVFNYGPPDSRHEAIERLSEFEHHSGGTCLRIDEPWDFDFREWDWQFLWCCWGIVQAIAQYDWEKGWR
jgi:hypothetical protein